MPRRKTHSKRGSPKKPKGIRPRVMAIAAFLAVSAVAGYYIAASGRSEPQTVDIRIGEHLVKVEVADTPELLKKGLSGRKRLKAGHGMLFVFQSPDRLSFWMPDTQISLSIAFISSEGMILQIEQMTPYDLRQVISHFPVQYALEVNQGFFKENSLTVGMHVDLSNVIER